MRKLLLLMLLVFSGCSAAHITPTPPNPPSKDFALTAKFSYDFTNFAQCSTTVTTGCVSGFTWGYLNGTAGVPLKTSPASICTGTTQPEACSDTTNSQLPIGSVTFFVVANFVNNAGTAGSSAQDTTAAPLVVAAGTPTGLAITAQ